MRAKPQVARYRRCTSAMQDGRHRRSDFRCRWWARWRSTMPVFNDARSSARATVLPPTGATSIVVSATTTTTPRSRMITGIVANATLKKHDGKWMLDGSRAELRRLAAAFDAGSADVDPENSGVDPRAEKTEEDPMRGGGLEPPRVLPH